jgi:hypothetical protein
MDGVEWYLPHTLDSTPDLAAFESWLADHSRCQPEAGLQKLNVPPWRLTWEDCEVLE